MTEKLYYKNQYIETFEAEILSCKKAGENYEIILDKSAFYPEGGGQPGDRRPPYSPERPLCFQQGRPLGRRGAAGGDRRGEKEMPTGENLVGSFHLRHAEKSAEDPQSVS